MFDDLRLGFQINNPRTNPRHWKNRGWTDEYESIDSGRRQTFDMPQALFWTAVSGLETPAARDLGGTMLNPRIPWQVDYWPVRFSWRDGWIVMSTSSQHDTSTTIPYYRPVRSMPRKDFSGNRLAEFQMLRAPFPLTTDRLLTAHSTVSLGHTDDPPFMLPYTGRPSNAMVDLMNRMWMKPGWIIWDGYLHVWVNYWYWLYDYIHSPGGMESLGVSVPVELALFRAYRVYYEQLHRELSYPYANPISWPDQCDPRFPMQSDLRCQSYL